MLTALLIQVALLKLAAAYSVAIPRITKDLGGTQIDIDVQVDIDTGADSPTIGTGIGTTVEPEPVCAVEGENCYSGQHCCDGLTCNSFDECFPKDNSTLPPTVEPPVCLAEGQKCEFNYFIGPGNREEWSPPEKLCCGDMKCGWTPNERYPTCTSQCLAENEECRMFVEDACCQGLKCDTMHIGGFGLPGHCRKDTGPGNNNGNLTPPSVSSESIEGARLPDEQCQTAGQPCVPGTVSRESTLVCCPNHLCDLDHKVCRRVAYRSLPGVGLP